LGNSGPTLKRARDCAGGSRTALCADYWPGGVPGPGVVVERSYIPSQPYEIAKNGKETGGFAHVLAYKLLKTPFFTLKYLTRYTHETFFEEYIYFKFFF
jgi:hypothetical protein